MSIESAKRGLVGKLEMLELFFMNLIKVAAGHKPSYDNILEVKGRLNSTRLL